MRTRLLIPQLRFPLIGLVVATASMLSFQPSTVQADIPSPPARWLFLDGHALNLSTDENAEITFGASDRVIIGVPVDLTTSINIGARGFYPQRFFIDGIDVGVGIVATTSPHRVAVITPSRHAIIDGKDAGEVAYSAFDCPDSPGVRITDTRTLLIRASDEHAILDGRDTGLIIDECSVDVSGDDILFTARSTDREPDLFIPSQNTTYGGYIVPHGYVNGEDVGRALDFAVSASKRIRIAPSRGSALEQGKDIDRKDLYVDDTNLTAGLFNGIATSMSFTRPFVAADGHVLYRVESEGVTDRYTIRFDDHDVGEVLRDLPYHEGDMRSFETANGHYGFINADLHVIVDGRDLGKGSDLRLDGNRYAFVRESRKSRELIVDGESLGQIGMLRSGDRGYDANPFYLEHGHLVYPALNGDLMYDGINLGQASFVSMSRTHLLLSYASSSSGERAGKNYPGYDRWAGTPNASLPEALVRASQEGWSPVFPYLFALIGGITLLALGALFLLRRHRSHQPGTDTQSPPPAAPTPPV